MRRWKVKEKGSFAGLLIQWRQSKLNPYAMNSICKRYCGAN